MTRASLLLLTSLCGVAALFSACRRQEGNPEPRTSKETDTALFAVNIGGKYGFINSKGSLLIPAQFDDIKLPDFFALDYFSEGLAAVCIGRCAFVNNGEIFHDALEQQVWQGNWGYIDKTGRFAINPQFSEIDGFAHGLASARSGERKLYNDHPRCGYIDHTGNFVISSQFSFCGGFDDQGMAAAAVGEDNDSRMGFIDTKGRFLINPQFYSVHGFHNGLAEVYPTEVTPRDFGYIDRSGKYVWRSPQPSSPSAPPSR